MFDHPLMSNNILREDLDELINFLKQDNPILTNSINVREFEKEWSKWLGVKYSVFVNSGASANLITISTLKHLHGLGEIIVPPLTWVSDIASVLQNGFKPIFVDINPKTLSMDSDKILEKLTDKTKGVFITHVQGFNGLSDTLLKTLEAENIPLIEDVCESHGATFNGVKLGSLGLMSNFSFYYAHHMSTIEGGMVCTNDKNIYEILRMFRSHGMVREVDDITIKEKYEQTYPELNPQFIFALPAFNVRNTEIGAILGRKQLKRLDHNNKKRTKNLILFLKNINKKYFRNEFILEGSSNYAFPLILNKPDFALRDKLEKNMKNNNIEFRRGNAGGGNQMRQPYLKGIVSEGEWENYPEVEHIHHFGWYIGNYPDLTEDRIIKLCKIINDV
jgi:CDP-4-dehydro-6-deoxyglucose reductase, E1